LQAPPEDIARYRDHYLKGWDKVREERWQNLRKMGIVNCGLAPLEPALTPRYFKPGVLTKLGPGEIEHALPWVQLTDEQKNYQATKMAIHAAMIDRMDREIGRVLEQVRVMGAWDNTVILFLSDNGTDATIMVRGDGHDRAATPGSAGSFLCLGPGWSSAGNAPFRRHKVWTHEGGISTPLIVHWPQGIAARGELRHDVGHVIDFVPTLLELASVKPVPVAGSPALPGRSLVPAFVRDGSVTRDDLFFNHEGNRALRMGDYKLVSAREDQNAWELFNLATDRCEQHNLAAKQPDRVSDMAARWQQLQDRFTRDAGPVLPIDKKPK
jgi:arylsulfatase